jgi:hypothetical protein
MKTLIQTFLTILNGQQYFISIEMVRIPSAFDVLAHHQKLLLSARMYVDVKSFWPRCERLFIVLTRVECILYISRIPQKCVSLTLSRVSFVRAAAAATIIYARGTKAIF